MFVHQFAVLSQSTVPLEANFGIQAKPIFPGVLIGTTQFDNNKDGFHTSFSQSGGFSFGGIMRFGLTRLITIETGINYTQRNFAFNSSVIDSNVFVQSKVRYITYDVPVSLLVYLPVSSNFFVDASVGMALSYSVSGVGRKISVPNTRHEISQLGIGNKVIAEAIASVGCEYRTDKKGIVYLGACVHVPFAPLFYLRSTYQNQGLRIQTDPKVQGQVDGSYIAMELKYFFPYIKSKGSPIKTPIE